MFFGAIHSVILALRRQPEWQQARGNVVLTEEAFDRDGKERWFAYQGLLRSEAPP